MSKKTYNDGGMASGDFLETPSPRMFENGGKRKEERKAKRTARRNKRKGLATAKTDPHVIRRSVSKPAAAKPVAKKKVEATSNSMANKLAKPLVKKKTEDSKPKVAVKKEPAKKAETFGQAYARHRKAGAKVFTWKNPKTGKSGKFTTQSKEEKERADTRKSENASANADDSKVDAAKTKSFNESRNDPLTEKIASKEARVYDTRNHQTAKVKAAQAKKKKYSSNR